MEFQFSKTQRIYLGIKRFLDITFSLLLIAPLLIPMGIFAIITKLTTKGTIIFAQPRMGKNKVLFSMRKFRSMNEGAPQVGQERITADEKAKYITKWGKFMRATSIDELPQLFSILAGRMSFIGPRPNLEEQFDRALVAARDSCTPSPYSVKPGMSGLAQVKLHRDPDPMHKAELDSEYVRTLSFHKDVAIFFASFGVIFHREKRQQIESANDKHD